MDSERLATKRALGGEEAASTRNEGLAEWVLRRVGRQLRRCLVEWIEMVPTRTEHELSAIRYVTKGG